MRNVQRGDRGNFYSWVHHGSGLTKLHVEFDCNMDD